MEDGTSGLIIGGSVAGAGNIISANIGDGIFFDGVSYGPPTADSVQGNLIGTDSTGSYALGNSGNGIRILSSTTITVGGTTATARNVISGNSGDGVSLSGVGANNNVVEGNYIGIDANGTGAMPNSGNGVAITAGAGANTIGGTATADGNIISGNMLAGISIMAANNTVQNNYIGTDSTGSVALGNDLDGIDVAGNGVSSFTVTGTVITDNVISANNVVGGTAGVNLYYDSGTVIQGNDIGTNAAGTAALGNALFGLGLSISTHDTAIGNVISANLVDGIEINNSNDNTLLGNFVGTNAAGTSALANGYYGIAMRPGQTPIPSAVRPPATAMSSAATAVTAKSARASSLPKAATTWSKAITSAPMRGARCPAEWLRCFHLRLQR